MATYNTSSELITAINSMASNPSAVLQLVMDNLSDLTSGEVIFVDPSNPAVSLFETAVMLSSANVDQNIAGLRRLYPSLAQTPEDLYHHMSYRDYLNRFASPSTDDFIFLVSYSQFIQRMVPVQDTDYSMIVIPRGTQIVVNKYVTYTLQYPIQIKFFDTQGLEVSYDTSVVSPLQSLTTNIVVATVVTEPTSQEKWIRFTIPAVQVKVKKVTDNIQLGRYFVKEIEFEDQFSMARAFYRNSSTSKWIEMNTTHSPTVYNPKTPTIQLKVINQVLVASIPLVYQNSGLVIGEVRIDIYTTKGAEIINMAEYAISDFVLNMTTLDPVVDTSVFTAAAVNVTVQPRSNAIMTGGKNALTFEQLQQRVINNTMGEPSVPITLKSISASSENRGFELMHSVDVVTDRIFLATRKLPKPSDPKLVTSANIGISSYLTNDPTAIDHEWVRVHGQRTTFLSKNLYLSENGVIRLLSVSEVQSIQQLDSINLLSVVNGQQFLYSPFYYVLDTSSQELQVRAYHLDSPSASTLNFMSQNATIQLVVNTSAYEFVKIDEGYKLRIQTNSGNFYKQLNDTEVMAQISVLIPGSSLYAYWQGVQTAVTQTGERVFEFTLTTDYDVDANGRIVVTNARIDSSLETVAEINLNSVFNIFHLTTSITSQYVPSDIDDLVGRFMLPNPCAVITREQVALEFGVSLDLLWVRARTLAETSNYETYSVDVPAVYKEDVFDTPAIVIEDNEIKYRYLAHRGDPMLDEEGEVIYEHRKGDIVYIDGEPVISSKNIGSREFDMLMIDGRHYFVNDPAYLDYNNEFVSLIVDWVTQDIPAIQAKALEKTKVFFYPKSQLTGADVVVADLTNERISSEQSITVDVAVTDEVFRNLAQRQLLRTKAIQYLDTWIAADKIAISTAIQGLKDVFGDVASSIMVSGLGGSRNLNFVNLVQNQQRLCLKRVLAIQQDGTYVIQEDVTVNFVKADPIVKN